MMRFFAIKISNCNFFLSFSSFCPFLAIAHLFINSFTHFSRTPNLHFQPLYCQHFLVSPPHHPLFRNFNFIAFIFSTSYSFFLCSWFLLVCAQKEPPLVLLYILCNYFLPAASYAVPFLYLVVTRFTSSFPISPYFDKFFLCCWHSPIIRHHSPAFKIFFCLKYSFFFLVC